MFTRFAIAAAAAVLATTIALPASAQSVSKYYSTQKQTVSVPSGSVSASSSTSMNQPPRPTSGTMQMPRPTSGTMNVPPAPRPAPPAPAPTQAPPKPSVPKR